MGDVPDESPCVPPTSNETKYHTPPESIESRQSLDIKHNRPLTMATFRRFRPDDVNKFSKCNLDPLTETYELGFYLQYHSKWPSLFQVCEDMDGNIVGYSGTYHYNLQPSNAKLITCEQLWARLNRHLMRISTRNTTSLGMHISQLLL